VSEFDGVVTIRRARYANDETGWAVLDAAGEDGEQIVLVGPLSHLEEREQAHVVGTWVDDSRYGMQVKVSEARPLTDCRWKATGSDSTATNTMSRTSAPEDG